MNISIFKKSTLKSFDIHMYQAWQIQINYVPFVFDLY